MTRTSQETITRETVFSAAIPLFAKHGYEGVTMDRIALAVGIRLEDLKGYFPDKRSLHLAAMKFAFRHVSRTTVAALQEAKPPLSRLNNFCFVLACALAADPILLRLLQHERLTYDTENVKLLYGEVFAPSFEALVDTVRELQPSYDPLLLSISVISMIVFHLELSQIQRLLPGWRPEHEWPETLSLHVTSLLEALLCK